MARIVIPGGSGYLGRALAARLAERGDDVVVLSRGAGRDERWRTVRWDAATLGDWVAELDGADAVVHLTGRRVDVRATARNVDELISSRVQPVRVVGEAVRACTRPPGVWAQSSSLAIFGEGGDATIDESTTPSGLGPREMVTVCLAWEAAFRQASDGIVPRPVLLRMGIGLGGEGDPATAKLARLVRLGLGGTIASGRQWVSWVGIEDLVDVMVRAVDEPSMRGTYHVTSPNPVTNAEMMATYRRLLGCRIAVPSPALVTRIGAPLLGSSASLALTGRRCVPTRLVDEGYTFRQPDFAPTARAALEGIGIAVAA